MLRANELQLEHWPSLFRSGIQVTVPVSPGLGVDDRHHLDTR